MLNGALSQLNSNSLIGEYSLLLGDAILRQRARAAEHTAQVEAELARRVKSEFISNMSHELRTPLNAMMGFSKLLSDHGTRKVSDAEIIEYAQLINEAATHLLIVINDILDISKIQSGGYTLHASEIDVGGVLSTLAENYAALAVEAGVHLQITLADSLAAVRGDRDKLEQALGNLISNAVKFSNEGGSVTVRAQRNFDDALIIEIADTGIGMSEQEIEIALTPFGQVDGSRTRWREGAGLGLPIAKSLVELHGGNLAIQSRGGEGTLVSIMLPVSQQTERAVNYRPRNLQGAGA